LALTVSLTACGDDPAGVVDVPSDVEAVLAVSGSAPAPPGGLVSVGSLELWPWTGRDLSGETADPVNLLFTGDVDVVSIRAALRALDGDRTAFGFPAAPPFDCTWEDANGQMQTTYSNMAGWVGSAIQLQCGNYDPVRFHIRLFDAGDWVIGAVHFDLLIPNTPEHQVLSWDFPQQFVMVDFLRSGLLTGPPSSQALQVPGSVQVIPKILYDGIPDALKVALGLPPGPAPPAGVPVPNDGMATVLGLVAPEPVADLVQYDLSLPFDQIIPRPFCSQGPADFVLLQGPVDISVSTRVNAQGQVTTHNVLRGDLSITPIDVSTGLPSGPTFGAQISQVDNAGVSSNGTRMNAVQLRKALPPGIGFLKTHLLTGGQGMAQFTSSEKCN
jgi:hypothetical protein